MATRKIKLKGYLYWSKVFEQNRDMEGFEGAFKEHEGACTIDIDVDKANLDLLKSSGSMKRGEPSPDNEGMFRIKKLKRKWVEEPYNGGAPKVKKVDGSLWDLEEDGLIGNGSYGEVILSVYDTARKSIVGTRLDEVIVVDHIPVEGSAGTEILEVSDEAKPKLDEIEDEDVPL